VQQVAVRGVQFDKVKAGIAGVAYRLAEIINDPRDLGGFERARHRGVDANSVAVFITQRGTGARANGRWRNRRGAARLDAAVRNAPGVPQLNGNTPVFRVYAGGDFFHAAICSGLCRPGAPA
jgi:hypothetical protein